MYCSCRCLHRSVTHDLCRIANLCRHRTHEWHCLHLPCSCNDRVWTRNARCDFRYSDCAAECSWRTHCERTQHRCCHADLGCTRHAWRQHDHRLPSRDVYCWLFGRLSDLHRAHNHCRCDIDLHRCSRNKWTCEWLVHAVPYSGRVFAECSNGVWDDSHDRGDTGDTAWPADWSGSAVHSQYRK